MVRIDREQVNDMLRRKQGVLSQRAFAKTLGVSASYLGDILKGNREPGPKILRLLKLRKTKTVSFQYEKAA